MYRQGRTRGFRGMDLYEIILDAAKEIAALDPQGKAGKGFCEWNKVGQGMPDHRLRRAKNRIVDIGTC